MRERRLKRTNGLCHMCLAEGIRRLATVVNHIIPLARGGDDVDDNTENLCGEHDDIVTAKQFGMATPIAAKGIASDGRPSSPDHAWNASAAPAPAGSARRPVPQGAGGQKSGPPVGGHRAVPPCAQNGVSK